MTQKFWLAVLLAGSFFLPTLGQATKSTYVYTDRRFQFVKRVEIDKEDFKDRQLNHPYSFTEIQLKEMLGSLKYDKKALFSKNNEAEEGIFSTSTLDVFVPYLAKAFKEAQPNEIVLFSFVTHKPQLLVRDDRLTIAKTWIEGNQLHVEFKKLMAKISNDYDKMSDVNVAISKAQGVRVAIQIQPGQQFGKSTDEVIWTIPDANTVAAAATAPAAPSAPATALENKKTNQQQAKTTAPATTTTTITATATPPPANAEGRLQQLDTLHKKGLINKDEYQKKRSEILNSL